jgi:hypothetical protein
MVIRTLALLIGQDLITFNDERDKHHMGKTEMKINWRVLIALILVAGVIYWAFSSVIPKSYSGSGLSFEVGRGAVTVANPSDMVVPAQLVGSRSNSFTVVSDTEGLSGSSTRQGSGANSTSLFEFELPPGTSEFVVTRGTNVNFITQTETDLDVRLQPVSSGELTTTLLVAVAIILGALFYISHATDHQWLSLFRGQKISIVTAAPIADETSGSQGRASKSYGDNRVGDLSR